MIFFVILWVLFNHHGHCTFLVFCCLYHLSFGFLGCHLCWSFFVSFLVSSLISSLVPSFVLSVILAIVVSSLVSFVLLSVLDGTVARSIVVVSVPFVPSLFPGSLVLD